VTFRADKPRQEIRAHKIGSDFFMKREMASFT
jgi:hypothetical protein